MLLGDRLFEAPIEDLYKILDSIQPNWVAPNCQFYIDDAQLEWTFPPGTFDFVHIRALYGSIGDWTKLYHQAHRTEVFLEAMDHTGKTVHIGMGDRMCKHMDEAGFIGIVDKEYHLPCKVQVFVATMRKTIRDPKLRPYYIVQNVYTRKPQGYKL
ncbi:UMTA protein [Diaporthe sp. PMI_573]|nr:UMTA protein [Diaporthaceae sp. PMI_573]